ncbi:hypothetical protein [Streptacidiphilus sp. EB129]|uniref:hypothetical protein n=1 Tax=Streptacidiphilus sp. EB129 TaxID=3156262 RepID=UPI00351435DF
MARDGAGSAGEAIDWLLRAAPRPAPSRAEWEHCGGGLTALLAGVAWDAVQTSLTLGIEAVDTLRYAGVAGPALCRADCGVVLVLVPVGTAATWHPTGGAVALGAGRRLLVPYPGQSFGADYWLIPPDGSGFLTDPGLLRTALRRAAALYAAAAW